MATLQEIENHLNIEIGNRELRSGRKKETKNQYYIFDSYYVVKLTQDKYMIVSNDDKTRELLKNHCWSAGSMGYTQACVNYVVKNYHQLYLNYSDGLVCDHINRVKYDNRFNNLRVTTYAVNNRNKTKRADNVSGRTGVYETKINEYPYIITQIVNNENKRLSKSFNIDKLGRDEACRQAISQRVEWENQFNYL